MREQIEMPPAVESLVGMVNKMFTENGAIPPLAVIYMQPEEGKLVGAILPAEAGMRDERSKDAFTSMLRHIAHNDPRVCAIAIVTESWAASCSPEEHADLRRKYGFSMERWPENLRREVVTINYQSPSRSEFWTLEIKRNPDKLSEPVGVPTSGGRMTSLFPPAN